MKFGPVQRRHFAMGFTDIQRIQQSSNASFPLSDQLRKFSLPFEELADHANDRGFV